MKEIYFINAQGEKAGPIEVCEIPRYPISGETLIWCQGMSQWEKASNVPEVSVYIVSNATPPPPPPIPNVNNNANASGYSSNASSYSSNASSYSPNVVDKKPDNYLWLSILTTVLCCLPLGVVAIINSNQVDNKWNTGDKEGAVKCSKNALMFSLISVGLGFVAGIISFIIGIAAG